MGKAFQSTTSRRAMLRGTIAAAAAIPAASTAEAMMTLQPTRAALIAETTDPVVALLDERARLLNLSGELDERVADLGVTLPDDVRGDPRPQPGAPHYETLLRLRDGLGGIKREDIERHMKGPHHFAALRGDLAEIAEYQAEHAAMLAWWDAERARMDKALEESGYQALSDQFDKASAGWMELEGEIAETSATSLRGIEGQLAIAVEALIDDQGGEEEMPDCFLCAVAALKSLQQLIAGGAT